MECRQPPAPRLFVYARPARKGSDGASNEIKRKAGPLEWRNAGNAPLRDVHFDAAGTKTRRQTKRSRQRFKRMADALRRYAKPVCEQTATVSVRMTPVEYVLAGNRPSRGQVAYRTALALFLAACACAVRGRSPFKMHGSGTALRASTLCRAIYGCVSAPRRRMCSRNARQPGERPCTVGL